jgi:hypothetical protein
MKIFFLKLYIIILLTILVRVVFFVFVGKGLHGHEGENDNAGQLDHFEKCFQSGVTSNTNMELKIWPELTQRASRRSEHGARFLKLARFIRRGSPSPTTSLRRCRNQHCSGRNSLQKMTARTVSFYGMLTFNISNICQQKITSTTPLSICLYHVTYKVIRIYGT